MKIDLYDLQNHIEALQFRIQSIKQYYVMFKIIENQLATEGIHEFSYHELKDVDYETGGITDIVWPVADVRDLYDDDSNGLEDYEKKN